MQYGGSGKFSENCQRDLENFQKTAKGVIKHFGLIRDEALGDLQC